MTEAALPARERVATRVLPMTLRIGWRNLWRNRRRTGLTAGGVAFAVFLVVAAACLQHGSYRTMQETATSLLAGHLQIQSRAYTDEERLEATLGNVGDLIRRVEAVQGVTAVAPRAEAYALASAGERSFGAQIMGVDPRAERAVVSFHDRVVAGRYLGASGEAVVGEGLARNLGVSVGDEVVLLGSGRHGGVAVLAVSVTGIFRTGMAEVDRALLQADLAAVRDAFDLPDQAHRLVIRTADLERVDEVTARLEQVLPERWPEAGGAGVDVRPWSEVLPDLRQAIEVDRLSSGFFYWMVMILVAFSVVNTFIMTVFERTREFGMLLAIGMRPGRILTMLQWEALFLWVVGTTVGLLLATALVAWLGQTGIHLGEEMERLGRQMYLPTRLYPIFTVEALITAPLVMLAGTQLAALLPSLRIRRLAPVDALRVAA